VNIKLCAKHLTPEKWEELKQELLRVCGIMNPDVIEIDVKGYTIFDSLRQEELLKGVK
jgi:hypothetical protein